MGTYILLNGEWFWGLGAMIGETMMKFSGCRTMRVSAIGIFLLNLPKKKKGGDCSTVGKGVESVS